MTYEPDRVVEWNKYAQRRMDEHLKPIDDLLVKWGKHAWYDGAPRLNPVTPLGRVIDEAEGASQSGAGSLPVPVEVLKVDWCVAQLRDIMRKVIEIRYHRMPHRPLVEQRRKLHMSEMAWKHRLNSAREVIHHLYKSIA